MAWNQDLANYNRLGQVYYACNQAGATVTLINTSTATGFILSNPWGSGKKLLLSQVNFTYTTVPTATAIVFLCQSIAVSTTAHTGVTALQVYGADGSGAATSAVGRAANAATTPNLPVYARALGYSPTTPATTGGLTVTDQVDGAIALVPGSYAQISYITTAPVGITYMSWVEVPV
tara:strand:- start:636 stop:1163 length:528 start_codon:yes stop_codon:yes gene_type:complete